MLSVPMYRPLRGRLLVMLLMLAMMGGAWARHHHVSHDDAGLDASYLSLVESALAESSSDSPSSPSPSSLGYDMSGVAQLEQHDDTALIDSSDVKAAHDDPVAATNALLSELHQHDDFTEVDVDAYLEQHAASMIKPREVARLPSASAAKQHTSNKLVKPIEVQHVSSNQAKSSSSPSSSSFVETHSNTKSNTKTKTQHFTPLSAVELSKVHTQLKKSIQKRKVAAVIAEKEVKRQLLLKAAAEKKQQLRSMIEKKIQMKHQQEVAQKNAKKAWFEDDKKVEKNFQSFRQKMKNTLLTGSKEIKTAAGSYALSLEGKAAAASTPELQHAMKEDFTGLAEMESKIKHPTHKKALKEFKKLTAFQKRTNELVAKDLLNRVNKLTGKKHIALEPPVPISPVGLAPSTTYTPYSVVSEDFPKPIRSTSFSPYNGALFHPALPSYAPKTPTYMAESKQPWPGAGYYGSGGGQGPHPGSEAFLPSPGVEGKEYGIRAREAWETYFDAVKAAGEFTKEAQSIPRPDYALLPSWSRKSEIGGRPDIFPKPLWNLPQVSKFERRMGALSFQQNQRLYPYLNVPNLATPYPVPHAPAVPVPPAQVVGYPTPGNPVLTRGPVHIKYYQNVYGGEPVEVKISEPDRSRLAGVIRPAYPYTPLAPLSATAPLAIPNAAAPVLPNGGSTVTPFTARPIGIFLPQAK